MLPLLMSQGTKNRKGTKVMGMAASQARFLGLTARKTNVEYEGQQINQQRTTLSNQTASYYTDLLGMSVPVPPSIEDYTKTVYTFQDGALTNSITSMIAQSSGLYKVSYTSEWTDDFAVTAAAPILYTRTTSAAASSSDDFEKKYMVGASRLRLLGTINTNSDGTYAGTKISDTETYYDEYLSTLSATQIANLKAEEALRISQLNEKYGTSAKGWLVRYVENTTTGNWEPQFVNADILESDNMVYDDKTGSSQTSVQTYKVGADTCREEIKNVDARLEQDTTGRIIAITLKPGKTDEVTYAVTTNTVSDQARYDDAMNQYEYDKAQYDQSIQEINAKIEIIQAEDKNLELRLKQLDTEQEAIQTEMDAVQKVIEKNTESSFKTFG